MSSKERVETGPAPAIAVTCEGDLVIKGWSEPAVRIEGDYELVQEGKVWSFSGRSDLQIRVPMESALHVSKVSGDMVVKYSGGDIAIDAVHGDLVLRGLAAAKVGTVHGDVAVRHSTGPARFESVQGDLAAAHVQELFIDSVNGDISGRQINGAVTIVKAAGDVDLRRINGPVTVTTGHRDANLSEVNGITSLPDIKGDIRLKGGLTAGNHVLHAGQDIILRWPTEMPLNMIATAPNVTNKAALDEFEAKGDAWIGRIGDSKTNLELTAGRQILIKDAERHDSDWESFDDQTEEFEYAFDFTNLGERISAQVNEKIEMFTRNMEQQFGADFGREIGERMARKAEQAAQRAEKAAERAAQRAEKAAERGRAQGDRASRWQDVAQPPPPSAPPPPKPASPEEQLKILRMVEKGTISPEEAGMLLEALEA